MGVKFWIKHILPYISFLSFLIAGFWFGVALYYFDSLYTLDIIYLGALFFIFFLLFSLSLIGWSRLRAENKKVWDEVPISVWITTIAIIFLLFFLVFYFFNPKETLEQFSGVALAFAAAVASPFAIWRITLTSRQIEMASKQMEITSKQTGTTSKQTEIVIKQTEIQQQAEYRQNYLDSIKNLESESAALRISAIQELGGQLKTDEERHLRIIERLSSVLRENTIQESDTGEKMENKRIIIQATLDALACRKPEWLPSGFELALSNITFNKNTKVEISLKIKNLKGANLRSADFKNTYIDDANLEEANLITADFTKTYFWGANFTKANLSRANFKVTQLHSANFTKADLYGANFKQAACDETSFEEANLCSADLSQATKITQEQINLAFGSVTTKLPPDLRMPPHWLKNDLDFLYSRLEWKKWSADPENYEPPEE